MIITIQKIRKYSIKLLYFYQDSFHSLCSLEGFRSLYNSSIIDFVNLFICSS